MTNEERLKELEMVSAIEHLAPFDVWAAPVNTFGEMVLGSNNILQPDSSDMRLAHTKLDIQTEGRLNPRPC